MTPPRCEHSQRRWLDGSRHHLLRGQAGRVRHRRTPRGHDEHDPAVILRAADARPRTTTSQTTPRSYLAWVACSWSSPTARRACTTTMHRYRRARGRRQRSSTSAPSSPSCSSSRNLIRQPTVFAEKCVTELETLTCFGDASVIRARPAPSLLCADSKCAPMDRPDPAKSPRPRSRSVAPPWPAGTNRERELARRDVIALTEEQSDRVK